MQRNKRRNILLFILPLPNKTILLGYTDEKIEILDISLPTYFSNKGVVKQKGYKASIHMNDMELYPTKGVNQPDCCWLHIAALCNHNIIEHSQFLQKYIDITIDNLLRIYSKYLKEKI